MSTATTASSRVAASRSWCATCACTRSWKLAGNHMRVVISRKVLSSNRRCLLTHRVAGGSPPTIATARVRARPCCSGWSASSSSAARCRRRWPSQTRPDFCCLRGDPCSPRRCWPASHCPQASPPLTRARRDQAAGFTLFAACLSMITFPLLMTIAMRCMRAAFARAVVLRSDAAADHHGRRAGGGASGPSLSFLGLRRGRPSAAFTCTMLSAHRLQ